LRRVSRPTPDEQAGYVPRLSIVGAYNPACAIISDRLDTARLRERGGIAVPTKEAFANGECP
jgi:hypothetical protein